jgi:hypothetical protein
LKEEYLEHEIKLQEQNREDTEIRSKGSKENEEEEGKL